MDVDERLEALKQRLEKLGQEIAAMHENWKPIAARIAKHEEWQKKIGRGIDAMLREWNKPEA